MPIHPLKGLKLKLVGMRRDHLAGCQTVIAEVADGSHIVLPIDWTDRGRPWVAPRLADRDVLLSADGLLSLARAVETALNQKLVPAQKASSAWTCSSAAAALPTPIRFTYAPSDEKVQCDAVHPVPFNCPLAQFPVKAMELGVSVGRLGERGRIDSYSNGCGNGVPRAPKGKDRIMRNGLCAVGLCMLGCGLDAGKEVVAELPNNLYLTGSPWPDKTVRVCWTESSRQRSDFASFSKNSESAATRSWTQATGLRFTDWGVCPAETNGVVVATMQSNGRSQCNPVSYNPSKANNLTVSPGGQTMMHEMGHCMGFGHEFYRPDFPDISCKQGSRSGNTLDTPADPGSIMAGMGYCHSSHRISYWDEIGAQRVYGFKNLFADVTGDGKDDAAVVRSDHMAIRAANPASTGFLGETSWSGGTYHYGNRGTFLADVSGDGRADLVIVNINKTFVGKSNGSSFPTLNSWTLSPAWGTLETHVADVTGDCRADTIMINEGETWVRPANAAATGFHGGHVLGPSRIANRERTVFANVSHVGAARGCWADAVFLDHDGVWVATSNGTTLNAATNWSGGQSLIGERATIVMDATGDGLADVVSVNTDDVIVYRSIGDGFGPAETWSSVPRWGERGVFGADVDGDGDGDLVIVRQDRIRVSRSTGSQFGGLQYWTASPYYGEQLLQ